MELVGAMDQTAVSADIVTLDSEASITSSEEPPNNFTGDIVFRAGLGEGFEVGASLFAVHVKYSLLDERRHAATPFSLALNVQGGGRYAGAGLLLSRQFTLGPVGIRPVANVWYQLHVTDRSWRLPPSAFDSDLDLVNPEAASTYDDATDSDRMTGRLELQEVSIPLGVEMPIHVADNVDLVPFVAYALSVPTVVLVDDMSCSSCLVGVESTAVQRRSYLWAGIKVQPPLRRPGSFDSEPPPADSQEAP